mgnify:FL=1|tara:strand:+ start:1448 stop:2050 length:603 start_codon:yes stop_codon:yes gene_type:complete
MWIHTETWKHGKEDYFLEKYNDDFFYKQLFDQQDVAVSGRSLTNDDVRKGLVRSKTSKSVPIGEHWTGYYKNEQGHLDTELVSTYTPKLIEILKLFNLYGKRRIYSFNSIWGQLSKEGRRCYMKEHDHYSNSEDILSWVHFIKVPEQKCFYFKKGDEKIYPFFQSSGDLIVFPSYSLHGVDERRDLDERFVIVGNIIRTK